MSSSGLASTFEITDRFQDMLTQLVAVEYGLGSANDVRMPMCIMEYGEVTGRRYVLLI